MLHSHAQQESAWVETTCCTRRWFRLAREAKESPFPASDGEGGDSGNGNGESGDGVSGNGYGGSGSGDCGDGASDDGDNGNGGNDNGDCGNGQRRQRRQAPVCKSGKPPCEKKW